MRKPSGTATSNARRNHVPCIDRSNIRRRHSFRGYQPSTIYE
ncbi:hypothetical protein HMPREF0972_02034 [Actinomyces sp. oral taxon 848 str. F0332]|nr:hypothetical protein HMPREF0972_02034 [Actinomyces sp. oral taxon 848 str. F0332]